ncbi:hypothetical protein Mapa_004771 [Marchantia paleacea]|nr:hypothetical protein Mapa_004771 [Marchantia paleacea]
MRRLSSLAASSSILLRTRTRLMNQRKATKVIVHDGYVGARDEKLFGDDLQRFQVDDLEQILIIAGNIVK